MIAEAQQVIMMKFLIFLPVREGRRKARWLGDELQEESRRAYVQWGRNQVLWLVLDFFAVVLVFWEVWISLGNSPAFILRTAQWQAGHEMPPFHPWWLYGFLQDRTASVHLHRLQLDWAFFFSNTTCAKSCKKFLGPPLLPYLFKKGKKKKNPWGKLSKNITNFKIKLSQNALRCDHEK